MNKPKSDKQLFRARNYSRRDRLWPDPSRAAGMWMNVGDFVCRSVEIGEDGAGDRRRSFLMLGWAIWRPVGGGG